MIKKIAMIACTGLLVLCFALPGSAFADEESSGKGGEMPLNASSGDDQTQAQGDVVAISADGASAAVATEGVSVSPEGTEAKVDGASFALTDFSRAQVGSNRDIDGAYSGYCYYAANSAGNLTVIATRDYAVVYVPAAQAERAGYLASDADRNALQRTLIALDVPASKGSAQLSPTMTWYFTSDQAFCVGDVVFRFDQEIKSGQFYACVAGVNGSDVTVSTNPAFVELTHADFARMVPFDQLVVAPPPTALESLVSFVGSIDYSPLWVTLKTTGTAIIFIFILGLAAAYFSLRIPPRAQDVVDSLFTIPMVLPPTVCGFLLLLAFGKNTAVGQWFIDIGFPLIFSWQATVIAAVVVAFPLMYRSARGAFENLDSNMMDAARTLGWSNAKIFFTLMLPLSWSSIAAGTVLSFARALGEFGATLFLAGNYLGITRTIPIAIYFEWMNGNTDVAIFWTIVIIIFSFIVILFINLWGRRTTKYRRGVSR
ncbi:MAG: molybdate ABC transporter permease subunit [Raoultibacter sp.]